MHNATGKAMTANDRDHKKADPARPACRLWGKDGVNRFSAAFPRLGSL
jgi:hypothetical protein